MLEQFLCLANASAPVPTTEYPNSGPGPTKLAKGNEQLGYFGEVTASDVITNDALRTHLGLTAGSAMADTGWFKFFYKGKVLFVSKSGYATGVTWDQVYAAGGIYGTNDTGVYPNSPAVNQYKPLTLTGQSRSWTVIPRTLQLNSASTYVSTSVVENAGNEYSDLLYRVSVFDANTPNSGQWASYSWTTLNVNRAEFGINLNNSTRCLMRGNASAAIANGRPTIATSSLRKNDATSFGQFFRAVLVVEGDPITG